MEVLTGQGPMGDGLVCSSCKHMFHNNCHPIPANRPLLSALDNSPSFVATFCPHCTSTAKQCPLDTEQLLQKLDGLGCALDTISNRINVIEGKVDCLTNSNLGCDQTTSVHSKLDGIEQSVGNLDMSSVGDAVPIFIDSVEEKCTVMKNAIDNSLTCMEEGIRSVVDQLAPTTCPGTSNEEITKEIRFIGRNVDLHGKALKDISDHIALQKSKQTHIPTTASYSAAASSVAASNVPSHTCTPLSSGPVTSNKSLCDETKTLAIDNIQSYTNFVKNSKDTKKEFNKFYEKIKIVHTKGMRRGCLLIELESKDEAKEISDNWNPACFSSDNGSANKTSATLLMNKNLRCVINDVDPELNDETVQQELKQNLQISDTEDFEIKRFTKNNRKLYTVMVTFHKKQLFEDILSQEQVLIGRSFCPIRKYKPKPYVVQCYNCNKFDHTARWCTSKKKVCPICSQSGHDEDGCLIFTEKDVVQYKCTNCKGNHASTSKQCPEYIKKLQYSSSLINDD